MKEQPIPHITVVDGDENEQDNTENVIGLNPLAEVLLPCMDLDQFDREINVGTEQEAGDDDIEVIPLAEVLIPCVEHDPIELKFDAIPLDDQDEAELNLALEDEPSTNEHEMSTHNDTFDDEEIIFMGDVPMPAKWCTADALTKQEDDGISGNFSFATRV